MHLGYLSTFEVVANQLNFTQAAKQLHITVGAVSQQMQLLEQQLGLSLFERHSRGVSLTKQGNILHRAVLTNLGNLRQVIEELTRSTEDSKEVRLKLTPSFAFKWLVPRLENFYSQHPNIKIQTFAEAGLVDHSGTDVDLTIDYDVVPYPKTGAILLFAEQLIPVMSPSYPQDPTTFWQDATLLHDATPYKSAEKHVEWQCWLEQQGIAIDYQAGHFFNRTDMAMAAAEAGVGIAMARSALINDELRSGKLIAPFEAIDANAGYFLLQHTYNPNVELFKKWLFGMMT